MLCPMVGRLTSNQKVGVQFPQQKSNPVVFRILTAKNYSTENRVVVGSSPTLRICVISAIGSALEKRILLFLFPGGVMVTQRTLTPSFLVRAQAGVPI